MSGLQQELISRLSEAGQLEYHAIVHYSRFAQEIEDPDLAQELRNIGQMEVRHSHQLMGIIIDLGGLPEWELPPLPWAAGPEDVIRSSLEGERRAIASYDQCLAIAQDSDLRHSVEQIKRDELYHIERLEHLLAGLTEGRAEGE
ncbi:MAG: ferritin-like domain-containing protein [Armatimonadota bacterium]|nr:MAG: ferritin-like domain-containing protein [Armatimonadota bacterium]